MHIKCFYELLQQTNGNMKPVDLPNKTTSTLLYYEICTTQVLCFVDFSYLMVFMMLAQRQTKSVIKATRSRVTYIF